MLAFLQSKLTLQAARTLAKPLSLCSLMAEPLGLMTPWPIRTEVQSGEMIIQGLSLDWERAQHAACSFTSPGEVTLVGGRSSSLWLASPSLLVLHTP